MKSSSLSNSWRKTEDPFSTTTTSIENKDSLGNTESNVGKAGLFDPVDDQPSAALIDENYKLKENAVGTKFVIKQGGLFMTNVADDSNSKKCK